jgi:hypothetical protein
MADHHYQFFKYNAMQLKRRGISFQEHHPFTVACAVAKVLNWFDFYLISEVDARKAVELIQRFLAAPVVVKLEKSGIR